VMFRARDYSWVGRPVLGASSWFKDNSDRPSGFHRMDGVWMALGNGIAAGEQIHDASIEDICPSVLYALGEDVPEGLDGSVLEASWSAQWLEENPVTYRSAEARTRGSRGSSAARPASDDLSERLAALGYLDLR